jgi:heat shock protein HtpX
MASLYTKQTVNKRRTFALFSIFLLVVIGIGWFLSYVYGNAFILYFAVIFAVFMNVIAYWKSDKIVLKMNKAKPADKSEYKEIHNIVENLAITAGLPKPKIYIVETPQLNAFATGRDPEHSVIAVTTGLIEILDRSELEGVLAHELSHIGNRDILISTVAVVLAGFVSILADFFLRSFMFGGIRVNDNNRGGGIMFLVAIILAVLAPIGSALIHMAISRQREYLADASGAMLTRYPEGLASALEKISKDNSRMKMANTSTAHLWIASPFKDKKSGGLSKKLSHLFSTHPSPETRINRLLNLEI